MLKHRNDLGHRAVLLKSTALAVLIASPLAQAAESGEGGLDEIIVTGTATAGGLKKLDTGFSVTTLSADQIKEANPRTPADILKASSGIYVESSGGNTGANIEVTGFPSSGGAPYATLQLNGVSLFPMSGQGALEPTSLFRLDDTIERVELVQGGPGVLYGNGQPGLTANYILKRGTDTPAGDLGFTYGSEGSERVDGFLGGALDKEAGLYGSIGGYWRRSDGVRDPQYTADDGGQVTATLSKNWDDGSLMVYGRYVNDHGQFVTDTPLLNTATGKFAAYPGFNPLTGTLSSKADQHEQLQVSPCSGAGCTPGSVSIDMANGRGPELHSFGAEFNWDFGHGLQVLDDLGYTGGVIDFNAFYSTGQNPETLGAYIAGKEAADKLPTTLAINAFYTNTGAAASLNQNVLTQELRYIQEKFHSVSNEIHVSDELFPGNTLTVGNYTALYGVSELEYGGSDMLLQAVSNPTPIGISLSNGTNTWQLSSPQGFVGGATTALLDEASGYNTAFFLSDSWKLDNWLFDAGIRTERQIFDSNLQNTKTGSLSGNPYELFNSSAQYFVPGMHQLDYAKTGSSWTVGLNYEVDPNMSAYVRANEGVHFPAFSDLSTTLPNMPLQRAHNYQVGYKYQDSFIYADLSAYYRTFSNVSVSGSFAVPGTTTSELGTFAYGSETKGLEYQITLRPFASEPLNGFTLSMTGDYTYGNYNHSNGCIAFSGTINETLCNPSLNYDGNLLTRQPIFQTRVTPAYTLPTDWGFVKSWATIEYVGKHYGDLLEQQDLGTYYDLSFGVTADVGSHWEVNLFGTNMTDQIGLTEGNARLLGGATTSSTILARSIEGREVSLQLKYKL